VTVAELGGFKAMTENRELEYGAIPWA